MTGVEWELIGEIQRQPAAEERRLVYADWLEDQGDLRAQYLIEQIYNFVTFNGCQAAIPLSFAFAKSSTSATDVSTN
jgi:uncharacterized protein (TIGR02996 family)